MADQRTDGESDGAREEGWAAQRTRLTRRTFLVSAAGAVGVAYVRPNRLLKLAFPGEHAFLTDDVTNPINPILPVVPGGPTPDIVIAAERELDLVLLDFAFYGFSVQPGTPPAIVPTTADNTVVIQFPPQAVGEGVYPWDNDNLPVDPPPILSDLSGPSRLCFQLGTSSSIPLPTMTVADLLDWSGWQLLVPAVAEVHNSIIVGNQSIPSPTEPTEFETSIEFPYALFLAPVVDESDSIITFGHFSTGFASRSEPLVSPAGVVDLWSTQLVGSASRPIEIGGGSAAPAPPYVPPVSAVWSADYNAVEFAPIPSATPENEIEYDLVVIK